ncbi:MAG: PilZ protein, partial [Candidatus Hydrogenedentes bacterium]|nr:PilZ protein [Candidatus Hydrogenedentota bacterium]
MQEGDAFEQAAAKMRQAQQTREPEVAAEDPRGGRAAANEEARRKRRHVIRHDCKAVVEMQVGFALPGEKQNVSNAVRSKARVLDLSIQGASLFTKEQFAPELNIQVVVTLKNGKQVTPKAVVRWVKPIPDKGGFAMGVQFLSIPTAELEHFRKFLIELD